MYSSWGNYRLELGRWLYEVYRSFIGPDTIPSTTVDMDTILINGVKFAQMTVSSNTLLTTVNTICDCNATAAAFSVALPTAVGNEGLTFMIGKVDSSDNVVTIDPNGTELISSEDNLPLEVFGEAVIITSDGTGWNVR